jgi:hypothetical protein
MSRTGLAALFVVMSASAGLGQERSGVAAERPKELATDQAPAPAAAQPTVATATATATAEEPVAKAEEESAPAPTRPRPKYRYLWDDKADLPPNAPPRPRRLNLSGPRVGVTFLSQGVLDKIDATTSLDDLKPVITQFGWQWEKQLAGGEGGIVALSEWVLLVGGMEQSTLLPSLTWIVGLRTAKGFELGVGPNITAIGTAIALAAGVNLRRGALSFPISLAIVPSKSGVRVSLLVGFTTR